MIRNTAAPVSAIPEPEVKEVSGMKGGFHQNQYPSSFNAGIYLHSDKEGKEGSSFCGKGKGCKGHKDGIRAKGP